MEITSNDFTGKIHRGINWDTVTVTAVITDSSNTELLTIEFYSPCV